MMEVPDSRKPSADTRQTLSRMERDWDSRAREAPEYYVATANREWQRDEFFEGGAMNVANEILPDIDIICQGKKFNQMRTIEIGCGVGRMTRALAALFNEVHAVDISAEMIALASQNLSGLKNVFLYKNNGTDLAEFPDRSFDFAFSFIVFQHIPDRGVIENYVREVYRCLKPGAVFKFQVQGYTGIQPVQDDTWVGAPIGLADAQALARRCGFRLIRSSGQGTQYFWLWFQKPGRFTRGFARGFNRVGSAIEAVRFWSAKPVAVTFSPGSVRAGETYRVRAPRFAGHIIDVAYEVTTQGLSAPVTGVVAKWCELDSQGEASIPVPADHASGTVRITQMRSQTSNSRWYRASGQIHVIGDDSAPRL
jgi:SAM-dependent methyltransferase